MELSPTAQVLVLRPLSVHSRTTGWGHGCYRALPVSSGNRRWQGRPVGGQHTWCRYLAAAAASLLPALRAGRRGYVSTRPPRLSRPAALQPDAVALPDGRRYRLLFDEAAVGRYICWKVGTLAKSAIALKGAFSMSIGSGTTVAPLMDLKASSEIDFSKFHIFFGNDRTEGDASGKCYNGAMAFVQACAIPFENVHAIGEGAPFTVAERYEAVIRDMPPDVVGTCERTGLPSLDLFLLGTGADGHTASLYPDSTQVLQSPSSRLIFPAEGKGGVTATIDFIGSARHVILSAAKPSHTVMVTEALGKPAASSNTKCPAGMVSAAPGTEVEWLVTPNSVPGNQYSTKLR